MKLSKDERPRKKKSFHRRSSAQRERSQIEAGESASNNKEINTNEAFFKCHISLNVYKRNIEVTCEPVSGVNTVFFVSPLRSWCAFSFEVDFLSRIKWKLEKKFHKCREHHCCFRDIGGRSFFSPSRRRMLDALWVILDFTFPPKMRFVAERVAHMAREHSLDVDCVN